MSKRLLSTDPFTGLMTWHDYDPLTNETTIIHTADAEPLLELEVPRYSEVSRFPAVTRDLAVLVPESAPAQGLLDALLGGCPASVQEIRLFDVYRGKGIPAGQKSLAFRVVMQDTAKTLTDGEADAAMAQLTRVLAAEFGARLRA